MVLQCNPDYVEGKMVLETKGSKEVKWPQYWKDCLIDIEIITSYSSRLGYKSVAECLHPKSNRYIWGYGSICLKS